MPQGMRSHLLGLGKAGPPGPPLQGQLPVAGDRRPAGEGADPGMGSGGPAFLPAGEGKPGDPREGDNAVNIPLAVSDLYQARGPSQITGGQGTDFPDPQARPGHELEGRSGSEPGCRADGGGL